MRNEVYYNKKYSELIGTIARQSNRSGTNMSEQYTQAKQLLKRANPSWDNVKIETTVLWDVREWWRKKHTR